MPRLPRFVPLLLLALLVVPPVVGQTCAPGTRGSLVFDGVDDMVRIPHDPVIDGMTNFTFEVWLKASPTGGLYRTIMDKGGENHYLVGVFQQAAFHIESALVFNDGPIVTDGIWRHLAITGAGNNLTMYIDGVLVAVGTYTAPLSVVTADLHFGAFKGVTNFFDHWSGALDDIRIWNVARTHAQIDANRLYVLNGSEPGLVAYYRFDQAPGQTVINSATSTGSALDGTLGPDAAATSQDPTFSTTEFPPMYYCASGTGQPNSAAARLQINGAGAGVTPGPFAVSVAGGTNLTMSWNGPANMPFALVTGYLNANNFNFGCVGVVDIGTPPFFADIDVFFDGASYPGSLFYVMSNSGAAVQVFSVPQTAQGLSIAVQGIVFQPSGSGCPVVLTAAFNVSVT
jgi:hypothetical protein